jgi:succinoglycan biosynthesis transport protein ExoP
VTFSDALAMVRSRWVSILLITAVVFAGAMAMTLLATKTYQAKSQVFVSSSNGNSPNDLLQGSSFTQNRVKSYADLVTSPSVLLPVIQKLGLATTPNALAQRISAESPLDTVLIDVTVTDPSPVLASKIANATADSLANQVGLIEKTPDSQSSPVRVTTTQTAPVPTEPATPNVRRDLPLGLLLGLALGLGVALLRERLDSTVRSDADVLAIPGASVIARIGYDEEATMHPLVVQRTPHSHRSEAIRHLRTNLQFFDPANPPRTIVVTSPVRGEGKTTTAINLAIALSDAGSRVALVDADLRRPSVAQYLGLGNAIGLSTLLSGEADIRDAIQSWGQGTLHVLPSGKVPPNPSELLGSRSMSDLLEQLTGQYDIVLIDTPALLPVTDAAVLASMTDGALMVAAAGLVERQQLAGALGSLQDVGARVLGVALNRLPHEQVDALSDYADSPAGANGRGEGRDRSGGTTSDPGRTPVSQGAQTARSLRSRLGKVARSYRQQVRPSSPGTSEDTL